MDRTTGAEAEFDYGLGPGESFEPDDDLDEPPFDLTQHHVMTVLGPIRPEELGVTLTHEHLYARPPVYLESDPDLVLDDRHAALAELEDLYAAGGRAILDATTADYGRDLDALHWIAGRAPVHLVAVTGFHKELHSGARLASMSPDDVAAECIAELTEGVGEQRIRAGAIKAGTSRDRIAPVEEVALRGAARAHLATGAPILTHCDRGTMALEQLHILSAEGTDPSRVILCHQDFRLDEPHLQSVLRTGAFISFDQISKTKHASDQDRAAMVVRLVDAGFAPQILFSGDLARRSYLRAHGGSPGLVYLLEAFPLLLMDAGLDAPTARQLLVDNPARALTIRLYS